MKRQCCAMNDQLPVPPSDLRARVTGTPDEEWFISSGICTVNEWKKALASLGMGLSDFNTVVDYGCGCGRALRQLLPKLYNNQRLIGIDTDVEAIKWINENISDVEAYELNANPPCSAIDDHSVNLVLCHSVFTHLPEDVQFAWLSELARILVDGGVAIISIHGINTIYHNFINIQSTGNKKGAYRYLKTMQNDGFLYNKGKGEFETELVDYYGSTFHDIVYVLESWTSNFEVMA